MTDLSAESVGHEIKRAIRRYEGYSSIIFKSGQANTSEFEKYKLLGN